MQQPVAPRRTLFHGPFGAGQSRHARDVACAAADAGARDILHVVANRTAAQTVRSELVTRRAAVFGLRVVTLRGLPREIERRARVKGVAIAGGVVDDLLVDQAVRAAARRTGSSIVAPGLAASAARTIAEMERGGGTVSSLESALASIPSSGVGPTVLLEAWKELERLRGSRTRSPGAAQRAAIELLQARGVVLLGACSLIVLEDLPLFGPLDREMIQAVVSMASCPIVATSEYARQLAAAPGFRAYELLRSVAEWDEQLCHGERASAGVAGRIFSVIENRSAPPKPDLEIVRLEAAGETAEVRLVARVVLRHLRRSTERSPIRASDILVVARGNHYRELIREIFAEAGIGVASGVRRTAADTALGSVLLELLQLVSDVSGDTRDRALEVLRSPHLDLGKRAADRLARRLITLGYLGLDGWDERVFHGLTPRTRKRVERLKGVIARARRAFDEASSNQEMTRAVRRLAKELRLVGNAYFARNRVQRTGSDDVLETRLANAAVREDNQAWEIIEQVLDDTMPELLRVDVADAKDGQRSRPKFAERWLSLFSRALNAESFERNVAGKDLVRVVGASAGDGQPAKVTFILGLRQHAFPRQPRQNPFVRDSLRVQLARYGIDMVTSEDMTDSERESFVRAVATAGETLYLSYAATDANGRPAIASFFLEDIQRAVGSEHQFAVERLGIADIMPQPEDAISRSEMIAAVAHGVWQRLPATASAVAERAASFLAWNDLLASEVPIVSVSGGRRAPFRPSFGPDVLQLAPHRTLELSASQLRTIQHCTYRHFVEKVLHPASLVAPEYDALTKGTIVHEAMMQWVKLDGWHRGDLALRELDKWFELRTAMLPPSARGSTLAQFTIAQDRERLNTFVHGELAEIGYPGAAQPTYNELAFGQRIAMRGDRDPASVASSFDLTVGTSLGKRVVKFTGSIDRVDTYHIDQSAYGIALDYKTGATSARYSKAMMEGTDLQLRLYLLALERLWNIQPVGALYVGFGDGIRRGVVSEAAVDHIGNFDPKCVRVIAEDDWGDFVHAETERLIQPLIERLVTYDITARPHNGDCQFCELDSICRYDPYGVANQNA